MWLGGIDNFLVIDFLGHYSPMYCNLCLFESSGNWHCPFDSLVICAAAIDGLRLCV